MKSLEEFLQESESFIKYKASSLSAQGRFNKVRTFQKNRWKLNRMRRIDLGRPAVGKRLTRRGELGAKRMLYKQLLQGRKKMNLSSTQRIAYERDIRNRAKIYEPGIEHNYIPKLHQRDTFRLRHFH